MVHRRTAMRRVQSHGGDDLLAHEKPLNLSFVIPETDYDQHGLERALLVCL